MRNVSIRTKILVTLALVNLLGAMVVMVYLHQSFSAGLDVSAERAVSQGVGAWEQLGGEVDPAGDPAGTAEVLGRMRDITGAEYGLLLDKTVTTAEAYSQAREKAGLADNWDEGERYALVAATDEAAEVGMDFPVAADSVPEIGRIVGVENGACTKTCHDNVRHEGAYWAVAWSDDGRSRAHGVFPVADAAGKPLGVVYIKEDISAQADSAEGSLMRTLFVIAGTLLAATLILGALLDTALFKRLNRMVVEVHDLSVRMAGGDFDVKFTPDGTADEIGKFEQFFATLVEVMTGTLKSLQSKDKQAS